jgi:predicted SAM-dependent methyltransferase
MMRRFLKRIGQDLYPVRRSRQTFWYLAHRYGTRDRKLANQYILQSEVRKLHLGCGWNLLPGWLNADYRPLCREVLYLDARQPFFFLDETFDYIFSEHMIEHISYNDGLKTLAECHRILRRGGKIRVSTPDLAFLIALYNGDKSSLQREYIAWANSNFLKDVPSDNEVFVINNFVRDWGHTFIYDEKTLKSVMASVGFTEITKYDLQSSADSVLCNLENLTRIPARFLEMETMTFEGTKNN